MTLYTAEYNVKSLLMLSKVNTLDGYLIKDEVSIHTVYIVMALV